MIVPTYKLFRKDDLLMQKSWTPHNSQGYESDYQDEFAQISKENLSAPVLITPKYIKPPTMTHIKAKPEELNRCSFIHERNYKKEEE